MCQERDCPIIVFSSGGTLTKNAKDMRLDRVAIPKGYQPRAALGYSLTLILLALEHLDFIPNIVSKNIL